MADETPSFIALLGLLRKGAAADDATEALRVLAEAVRETGKSGSLTIDVKLKPLGGDAVEITDIIKIRQPRPEAAATIMFLTEHGVTRRHPDQAEMWPTVRDVTPTYPQEEAANG